MQIKDTKPDRRVLRTKSALREAIVVLIEEKHYDSITVQDIIDRADVGRSTFYSHFRDKEDLFRSDWEHFLKVFVQHFEWENLPQGRLIPIERFFEHLKDFHPFYRGLVRSGKIASVLEYGKKYSAKLIEAELGRIDKKVAKPLVPTPILANYLAEEIFSILKWWLDQNMPYTPRRMERIFQTLVMPGVRRSLETTFSSQ
jgi:AcrR family transcriptional regulator